jgi:type IV pilus assembly protein PilB
MPKTHKRLGEVLLEKGLITTGQLNECVQEQAKTKEFLGAILLKRGFIKEKDLLAVLSQQFDIPVYSLKDKYIDWGFVKSFSASLILDYKYFPIQKDDSSVTFATRNPLDIWALQKAEQELGGLKLRLVLVSQSDVFEATQRFKQYIRGNILKRFE